VDNGQAEVDSIDREIQKDIEAYIQEKKANNNSHMQSDSYNESDIDQPISLKDKKKSS